MGVGQGLVMLVWGTIGVRCLGCVGNNPTVADRPLHTTPSIPPKEKRNGAPPHRGPKGDPTQRSHLAQYRVAGVHSLSPGWVRGVPVYRGG